MALALKLKQTVESNGQITHWILTVYSSRLELVDKFEISVRSLGQPKGLHLSRTRLVTNIMRKNIVTPLSVSSLGYK